MTLRDTILKVRPLLGNEAKLADELEILLPPQQSKHAITLRKQLHVTLYADTLGTTLVEEQPFPQLKPKHAGMGRECAEINTAIRTSAKQRAFQKFSGDAFHAIAGFIAPQVSGNENVKEALALQLFSTEQLHVLLLADHSSGAVDIAKDAAAISPTGQSVTAGPGVSLLGNLRGTTLTPGPLPKANNGLLWIDQLSLLREDARVPLASAMDKATATYHKSGHHQQFDAKVNVLATASPRGDKFIGDDVKGLKKQIPFDTAFLNRFHLQFIIRKPGVDAFTPAKTALPNRKEADVKFLQDYIAHARGIDVKFPSALMEDVTAFLHEIKQDDGKRMVQLSPKLTQGFITMAKSSARMELRTIVSDVDLLRVKNIIRQSMEWKG